MSLPKRRFMQQLSDLLSTGIFFRGTILSGHIVILLCRASILHHPGGLHKTWDCLLKQARRYSERYLRAFECLYNCKAFRCNTRYVILVFIAFLFIMDSTVRFRYYTISQSFTKHLQYLFPIFPPLTNKEYRRLLSLIRNKLI